MGLLKQPVSQAPNMHIAHCKTKDLQGSGSTISEAGLSWKEIYTLLLHIQETAGISLWVIGSQLGLVGPRAGTETTGHLFHLSLRPGSSELMEYSCSVMWNWSLSLS